MHGQCDANPTATFPAVLWPAANYTDKGTCLNNVPNVAILKRNGRYLNPARTFEPRIQRRNHYTTRLRPINPNLILNPNRHVAITALTINPEFSRGQMVFYRKEKMLGEGRHPGRGGGRSCRCPDTMMRRAKRHLATVNDVNRRACSGLWESQ